MSYLIPVVCLLIKKRNITHGPFWLGSFGMVSNIVLICWVLFTLVMCVQTYSPRSFTSPTDPTANMWYFSRYSFPTYQPVESNSESPTRTFTLLLVRKLTAVST